MDAGGGGKRAGKRALALALGVAPLAVGELVLRACGVSYPRFEVPIQIWNADEDRALATADALHRSDDRQLWTPRPGAALPWAPQERVSPGGFRGADPDPAARPRVLALGDSSTFGWTVAAHETWPALLEADLRRELGRPDDAQAAGSERTGGNERSAGGEQTPAGLVQVVNGGVIGSTIRQGLERCRVVGETWRPDVVVAGFGTVNEHVPTMDMVDVEKMAWLRDRRSLLWRAERFVRNDVRLANAVAWAWDELHGGREAILQGFLARERERRQALQGYRELDDYPRRVSPADFRLCLEELERWTRERGARLVLVRMPRRESMEAYVPQVLDYDRELDAFLATTPVPCVDARGALRARIAAGTPEDDLLWDGTHPRPAGQRIVADALLPVVRSCLDEVAGSSSARRPAGGR